VKHSGISGYRTLRGIEPELCRAIVILCEDLVGRYHLEVGMCATLKQEMCQFALDHLVREATRRVFKNEKSAR
jgi:hypothetical protein